MHLPAFRQRDLEFRINFDRRQFTQDRSKPTRLRCGGRSGRLIRSDRFRRLESSMHLFLKLLCVNAEQLKHPGADARPPRELVQEQVLGVDVLVIASRRRLVGRSSMNTSSMDVSLSRTRTLCLSHLANRYANRWIAPMGNRTPKWSRSWEATSSRSREQTEDQMLSPDIGMSLNARASSCARERSLRATSCELSRLLSIVPIYLGSALTRTSRCETTGLCIRRVFTFIRGVEPELLRN